jgi:hypothetical protein
VNSPRSGKALSQSPPRLCSKASEATGAAPPSPGEMFAENIEQSVSVSITQAAIGPHRPSGRSGSGPTWSLLDNDPQSEVPTAKSCYAGLSQNDNKLAALAIERPRSAPKEFDVPGPLTACGDRNAVHPLLLDLDFWQSCSKELAARPASVAASASILSALNVYPTRVEFRP